MVVRFPFADLSGAKHRPALVLARAGSTDLLLCLITSRFRDDPASVRLDTTDFQEGGLRVPSNIRPHRLFTAEERIVRRIAGRVSEQKLKETIGCVKLLLDES